MSGIHNDEDEMARLSEKKAPGFFRELLSLLAHNKKWWLIPALIMMLILSFLILLAGSGAAPFIYTLF
ncbi:hypothetical protein EPN96_01650 [bacterium]|nr:MAG: hypothetical protein EPN96_01650 [bacterium]